MISVIVPVYNAAPYLNQCIESIVKQTYTDWECILINDGSTDKSGEICRMWEERDSRIHVINQSNQGVSAARNQGIEESKGEYLVFIDSDDWVDIEYLSVMIKECGNCDLTITGIIDHYADGKIVAIEPDNTKSIEIGPSFSDELIDLLKKNLLYGPTCKLYNSQIIKHHNIKFPIDCSLGEDLEFNFEYLGHISTIKAIATSHYHYRKLPSGSLFTKIRLNQFETDLKHWRIRYNFFKNKGLLDSNSMEILAKLLWGLIYDGIFRYESIEKPSLNYLKLLDRIPETTLLKQYQHTFDCAPWIKYAITRKLYIIFYLYFKFKKSINKNIRLS